MAAGAGAVRVVEGTMPFDGHSTWYRITGDPEAAGVPLVVIHGGPGAPHDYLLRYAELARSGRPVIHYDQLGCGRSTHLPEAPDAFWTLELFLRELDALLSHLGITDRYALLGQSWGGVLAAEHAVRQPRGLRALVIANSPASIDLWVSEADRLRADLPPEVQATLLRHEAAGTTRGPAYQDACKVFYARHVCRLDPMPPEVVRTEDALAANMQVFEAMNGPSEFHVIGSMRHWTIVERLGRIAVPTLLVSGRYDEATPATVQPFADRIPDVRWALFEHSSHMPHVEEAERCLQVVGDFLASHDQGHGAP
jgi:L-proline amide hydrolase